MPQRTNDVVEYFWARVNKNGPTLREELGPCWLWTGTIRTAGKKSRHLYGKALVHGSQIYAHRLSAMIHGFNIEGKVVCHRCDNPTCVRIEHLYVASQAWNIQDMFAKGRQNRARKITAEKAMVIMGLRASGKTGKQIAAHMNLDQRSVWAVLNGETWAHLPRLHADFQRKRQEQCINGHLRTEHGFRYPKGNGFQWMCRECRRQQSRATMAKRRALGIHLKGGAHKAREASVNA